MADEYGSAELRLIYLFSDGIYIDPDDAEELKDYVVVDQKLLNSPIYKSTIGTEIRIRRS